MELNNIYRMFHPNTKQYTFYSAGHGNFFKIDHIDQELVARVFNPSTQETEADRSLNLRPAWSTD